MTQRITEDIRFYLPADPYYYQVDNLPLEDLLTNDVRLQSQIDEINSAERGNTVGRAGFTELQPFIDAGIPGTISVRPGNFIGRVQRGFGSGEGAYRNNNGRREMNNPPTTFGSGDNPTGTYFVHNPPNHGTDASQYVGRTALFNFKGANISIDSFDFDAFEWTQTVNSGNSSWTTPPLGRIDLIGITTVNGAMDDANVPGNQSNEDGALQGTGLPKLAVVKGAGIVQSDNGRRQVVIGEKYITIGTPQDRINDYGRDLEGNVVPNPEFGTVPMPDDVVNVNFARNIVANGEIAQSLNDWSLSNKNASFFLPVAYVYVPQSHVEGNPIPEQHMSDIRPFFRTAELALAERQAVAASLSPSLNNPFVTEEHMDNALSHALTDPTADLQNLMTVLQSTVVQRKFMFGDGTIGGGSVFFSGRKSNGWHTYNLANINGVPINAKFITVTFNGQNDHNNAYNYYRRTGEPHDPDNICFYLHGDGEGGPGSFNTNTIDIPCEGGSFSLYFAHFNGHYAAYCNGYITEEPILS